jgi:hypothetical protein
VSSPSSPLSPRLFPKRFEAPWCSGHEPTGMAPPRTAALATPSGHKTPRDGFASLASLPLCARLRESCTVAPKRLTPATSTPPAMEHRRPLPQLRPTDLLFLP